VGEREFSNSSRLFGTDQEALRKQFRTHPLRSAGERGCQSQSLAEEQTHGRIKDIVSPRDFNQLTALIAADAIYFKGKWEKIFDKSHTRIAPFISTIRVRPGSDDESEKSLSVRGVE